MARACGGNVPLRREVESLLAAYERAGGFLEGGALEIDFEAIQDLVEEAGWPDSELEVGGQAGAYRIVSRIGAGGMGAVFLGERADAEFDKQVAVKILKRGLDTEEVLRRFRQERQVLANLEHPNIARLIDGGATDEGTPYLVMEHVDGAPIDRYCDQHRLTIGERLELFRVVCSSVSHAHRNLVVHRDLKPSNILVTDEGEPKLLDFGIAKVLRSEDGARDLTVTRRRFLSPRYASPEQVRGEAITTASDVYSLGVVLYELLTGRPPYPLTVDSTPRDVENLICRQTPPRPSSVFRRSVTEGGGTEFERERQALSEARRTEPRRLRRRLSGDLDTIVLTALRKEPDRRYASVVQLSEDIDRFLRHLPVLARPDSFWYRSRKFVRRNAAAVGASVLLFASLAAAAVLSTVLFLRADSAQRRAETERQTAEQISRFLQDMLASINPTVARGRDVSLLRELLEQASSRVEHELDGEPEVASALHVTIGNAYRSLALYDESEPHYRQAVEIRRRLPGEGQLDLAGSLFNQGRFFLEIGRYEEAEGSLRESLDIHRDQRAPDRRATAAVLDRLATALEATEDYEGAEAALREALDLCRQDPDGDATALAQGLNNLGLYLMNPREERLDEAEPMLREALAIYRASPDPAPSSLAVSVLNLGSVLRRKGELDAAEPLYREALDLQRQVLEEDHPRIAVTVGNLATLQELRGDYEAAEGGFREALAIQRRSLGEEHRDVGTAMNNLAGALRRVGRYDEAEQLYRRAIDIYEAALGPDHLWTAIVLGSLALNHEQAGEYAAAEATAHECLRVRRLHWPDDHWRVALAESVRGGALRGLGRYAESEKVLLRSASAVESQLGSDNPSTRQALERIVDLYEAWGKPERAEQYRARLESSDDSTDR